MLETELLKLGPMGYSWKIRDAICGVQIYGATGSGKTSGSGATIAKSYLKAGWGGLVLCAKPDEAGHWEKYCEETRRLDDLIMVTRGGEYGINLLGYENRKTEGGDETLNLTNLIMQFHEIERTYSAGSVKGGDMEGFWQSALRRIISRTIDLLKLARLEVSIENMHNIVHSTIKDKEFDQLKFLILAVYGPSKNQDARAELDSWTERSFFIKAYDLACRFTTEKDHNEFELVSSYFTQEFPRISERTTSIIKETFNGVVEFFLKGLLKDHFCTDGAKPINPELTYLEGKIIVLALDIKTFGLAGVLAQAATKYIFQRALERRNILAEEKPRCVFLWADEAQYFVNPEHDSLFQTTARSSLVSTVYLTQSLNNYLFMMGANNPGPRAKSMLANLNTRIFHNNSDIETNQWLADLIGKNYMPKKSDSLSRSSGPSMDFSPHYGYLLEPQAVSTLKTGGKYNNGEVEAIIHINTDRKLSAAGNFGFHSFYQKSR